MLHIFFINQVKLVARTLTMTDIKGRSEQDAGCSSDLRRWLPQWLPPKAICTHVRYSRPVKN
jgi:hypothetical protein